MQKKADITLQNNIFILSGEISFANVMSLYQKSLLNFSKIKELKFDFSQVKNIDSAGLALILEWIKLAKTSQQSIHFSHLPENLLSIAHAAGMQDLLKAYS